MKQPGDIQEHDCELIEPPRCTVERVALKSRVGESSAGSLTMVLDRERQEHLWEAHYSDGKWQVSINGKVFKDEPQIEEGVRKYVESLVERQRTLPAEEQAQPLVEKKHVPFDPARAEVREVLARPPRRFVQQYRVTHQPGSFRDGRTDGGATSTDSDLGPKPGPVDDDEEEQPPVSQRVEKEDESVGEVRKITPPVVPPLPPLVPRGVLTPPPQKEAAHSNGNGNGNHPPSDLTKKSDVVKSVTDKKPAGPKKAAQPKKPQAKVGKTNTMPSDKYQLVVEAVAKAFDLVPYDSKSRAHAAVKQAASVILFDIGASATEVRKALGLKNDQVAYQNASTGRAKLKKDERFASHCQTIGGKFGGKVSSPPPEPATRKTKPGSTAPLPGEKNLGPFGKGDAVILLLKIAHMERNGIAAALGLSVDEVNQHIADLVCSPNSGTDPVKARLRVIGEQIIAAAS